MTQKATQAKSELWFLWTWGVVNLGSTLMQGANKARLSDFRLAHNCVITTLSPAFSRLTRGSLWLAGHERPPVPDLVHYE